ncbi:MAG: hypothetical protein Q8K68_04465, partial [Nitrospirota bacterium]|nr:hypothetical protein [Nitrospirota bacterium]
MKKILVVLAAAVLVLSFAGAALAIHAEIPAETQAIVAKGSTQITLGGEIRVRGWYYNNLAPYGTAAVPGTPVESNSKANWDQRVRLNIDAQVTPNVQAYIQLESSTAIDGQKDTWTWGNLNTKPATMNIAQAWILYTGSGLFGFNSGLKVGHMPLKLGEGQFFDNTQFGDDAVVFFMDPTKELHIGLLTIKASDGSTGDNTDDLDAYVGLMTYKIAKTHTLGMNYTYINKSDWALKFQNLGLHANGTAGKFGYKAEVDFQFGSVDEGADKAKFRGVGVFLAANYKVTPEFNLRGSFAYGSGDTEEDNKNTEFQTLVGT